MALLPWPASSKIKTDHREHRGARTNATEERQARRDLKQFKTDTEWHARM